MHTKNHKNNLSHKDLSTSTLAYYMSWLCSTIIKSSAELKVMPIKDSSEI